jgi:hypothetical protein
LAEKTCHIRMSDMVNELIPPAGMEHSISDHLTPDQRVAAWADLMDASEELLLAGLSRQIGPDGDLREAYRRCYVSQMEQHDQAMRDLAENLYRRGLCHGH